MPLILRSDNSGVRLELTGSRPGGLGIVLARGSSGHSGPLMAVFTTEQARDLIKDIEYIIDWQATND